MAPHPTAEFNRGIAARLEEAAALLESRAANPFRVRAYRRAADTIASHPQDIREYVAERGADALEDLPNVGPGIAAVVRELLATGRSTQLERLRTGLDPEALLATVPGVGAGLARQMRAVLHVETLEDLEAAAWDGRLAALRGIGPRRLDAIRTALAQRLGRLRGAVASDDAGHRPSVGQLLEVDAIYRERVAAGALPTIAPRRFNPAHEAWLPILHHTRGTWHYTAMYSNTALAHRLGRTRDWVVIYCYDRGHEERQCTVVTESTGELAGRRVVRGREAECLAHYGHAAAAPRRAAARLRPTEPRAPGGRHVDAP